MTGVSEYRRAQAWTAGQKARAGGKPRAANNRQPCTIYYDDWADGWEDEDHRLWAASSKDAR